jgi:hypothetical protein
LVTTSLSSFVIIHNLEPLRDPDVSDLRFLQLNTA